MRGAKWIRHFVREHPEYKRDSLVSEGICYDLVRAVEDITQRGCRDGRGGVEIFKVGAPRELNGNSVWVMFIDGKYGVR